MNNVHSNSYLQVGTVCDLDGISEEIATCSQDSLLTSVHLSLLSQMLKVCRGVHTHTHVYDDSVKLSQTGILVLWATIHLCLSTVGCNQ